MRAVESPHIIRFGLFRLDSRTGELHSQGHKVRLQEQSFQILKMLLEQPGEVVTMEQIRRTLWSDDTIVEFENSVHAAIKKLRLALGDSAENPRYVETLPRKGYRFICPVETPAQGAGQEPIRLPDTSQPAESSHSLPLSGESYQGPSPLQRGPEFASFGIPSIQEPPTSFGNIESNRPISAEPRGIAERLRKDWGAWAVATLAVLLVAVGSAYWMGHRGAVETADAPLVVPFTTYPGFAWDPSFSPDGNQVAFGWDGGKENQDIYIKQIGSDSPRRLTTDPHPDHSPAWAPDGQSIAFVRNMDSTHASVMLIPVNGGREHQLAEILAQKLPTDCRLLWWHPDGKWLAVVSNRDTAEAPSAIGLLSPETGERRWLTSPPRGSGGDTNPAFSPDGHILVFARFYGNGDTSELYLLRVGDGLLPEGEPKQLTFANQCTIVPAWTPDGKEIIYASGSDFHHSTLWRILASGSGKPRPLPFYGEGLTLDPAISPRNHRLVYKTVSLGNPNIWRCQISQEGEKPIPQTKFAPSTMTQDEPQYSPDGNAVAYIANASGNAEVWVSDKDGTNPLQLTHLGGPLPSYPRWSPDGQEIVFSMAMGGQSDLYLIPAQGGQIKQLSHTRFNAENPSYSRDGKWIYFTADRSGDGQVWKIPAEGGEAVQVTRKGGSNPQESMDGKRLFYLKPNNQHDELWMLPMDDGEGKRVLEDVFRTDYNIKQKGIYFAMEPNNKGIQFLFYSFATRKTRPIATIQGNVGYGFTVSPDEQWILSVQAEGSVRSGSDLMLVENFR